MGVKSSPRAGPGFQSHPTPKANSCVRGRPQGQDKPKQLPSPPKKSAPVQRRVAGGRGGQREGAEPEPPYQSTEESPESVPKPAHGGRAWETSWKQLRTDLLVMPHTSPGCWTKPQAGADSRVKEWPATAGGLCLPAQSCQSKSLLAPKPRGSGGLVLPQPLAAGSTQGRGQGWTLPSPSSAALGCPWGQRTSPRAHSPQPHKSSPKARGTQRSQHPAALGLLQEPCIPPSPPRQERVPPRGNQAGKRSVTG